MPQHKRNTKEAKTAVLHVRIRPSVKDAAARAAEADGRSLASYIERLIERDAKPA